jgi:hypothetical protein
MGFALPKDVVPDTERHGRLRAKTQSKDYSDVSEVVDFKNCHLHDLASKQYQIDLATMGFDSVDLSSNAELVTMLEKIKAQGVLENDDISRVRQAIRGSVFKLSNGKRIRMLYVAGEGVLLRTSGPNGLQIKHDEALPTHSKQAAAMMVHGDQDVYGFPLKRIMKGAAPWLFKHSSPDGSNNISPINLVNFWVPLQQINTPLCLMDRTTLNNQDHQLRFEINVSDTLERTSEHGRNDIWAFLHDDKQAWYFNSEMNYKQAYVFDTLGIAHGAAILPGEKEAEQYFLRISDCQQAFKEGNKEVFRDACSKEKLSLPSKMTAPLAAAIGNMEAVLEQAESKQEAIFLEPKGDFAQLWMQTADAARNAVIRKSIELRAVALVY